LLLLARGLRSLLQLDPHGSQGSVGLAPLDPTREATYQPTALEMQTQAAIIGVSLNDAMDEWDAGRTDTSWRLVRLSGCQWERLAQVLLALLETISDYLPSARLAVSVRSTALRRFKSLTMADYVRAHEWLDQLVFRHKLRFKMNIRLVRRAAETLTAQFAETNRAVRSPGCSPAVWHELDICFHDFDLLIKETLLAFRALLASLPEKEMPDLAVDLERLNPRGVRRVSGK